MKDRFDRLFALLNKVTAKFDAVLPGNVPRDRTTRGLVNGAVIVYVADLLDPLPIGELLAGLFLGYAAARGAWLARKEPSIEGLKNYAFIRQ